MFGHSIHPILVMFPFGLFSASVIFDGLALLTGRKHLARASVVNLGAGLLGGVPAALFGYLDWRAIPEGTRAKALGRWHGLGNGLLMLLFGLSWLLRRNDPAALPSKTAFGLEVAGISLGGITGWMGGELVERLGIGVQPGAHPNAPNSLLDAPAAANARGYGPGAA
jgi:uncharacterized membrane protein